MRAAASGSAFVRCVAPRSDARHIYAGQHQRQPHLYGVVVPMTKLPRAGVSDVATPGDWNTSQFPLRASAIRITRYPIVSTLVVTDNGVNFILSGTGEGKGAHTHSCF